MPLQDLTPVNENGNPIQQPRFFHLPQLFPQQQQQQQPIDYSPVKIPPAEATPAETRLESIQPIHPTDPQFHQRRLWTVLDAIGAGLAGASGGAKVGMETADQLRNAKFYRAQAQQERERDLLKEQIGSEKERSTRGEREVQYGFQKGAAEALGQSRQVNALTRQQDTNIKGANTQSLIEHRKSQDDYTRWKQANPKLDDTQWVNSAPTDEERIKRLDLVKEINASKRTSVQEAGDKAATVEQAKIDADAANLSKIKSISEAKGTGVASTIAKKALTPEEQSSVSVLLDQAEGNPDGYWDLLAHAPTPETKAAFIAGSKERGIDPAPEIKNTTLKQRVFNSRVALDHVKGLRELMMDPEVLNILGPVSGRIAQAMRAIGPSLYKGTPEEISDKIQTAAGPVTSDKEQKLMGLIAYLVTFEASSISGTRPSHQLINYIKSVSASTHMDPKRFLGALEATEAAANYNLQEAYKGSNRGKIVEPPKKKGEKEVKDPFWNNLNIQVRK